MKKDTFVGLKGGASSTSMLEWENAIVLKTFVEEETGEEVAFLYTYIDGNIKRFYEPVNNLIDLEINN